MATETSTNGSIPFRELVDNQMDRLKADITGLSSAIRETYDARIMAIADSIDASQLLTSHRFGAQEDAVAKAFDAQEKSVAAALAAQQRAVDLALAAVARESALHALAHDKEHHAQAMAAEKAEKRADERFEEGNGFRKQIEGERLLYVRRDMLDMAERNARDNLDKMEADIRLRMEKLEADQRSRIEKVEADLRQRIEVETAARVDATTPLASWQSMMTGKMAVWAVGGGILLTVIVFLANYLTRQ